MARSVYGIIGYPLGHSFSPAYFNRKFRAWGIDAAYNAYPLATVSEFPGLLLSEPDLRGLSVTIPYKKAIIPLLDSLDAVAEEVGAVNCIAVQNGKTRGYNTDVIGFSNSLAPLLEPHHQKALVLGNGGAAGAVKWGLSHLGISYQTVSRTKAPGLLSYEDVTTDSLAENLLIINTTPLGMYPNADGLPPLPYTSVTSRHLLFDLVYNPAETRFLAEGRVRSAKTRNGLEMLEIQAEEAWKIWNS